MVASESNTLKHSSFVYFMNSSWLLSNKVSAYLNYNHSNKEHTFVSSRKKLMRTLYAPKDHIMISNLDEKIPGERWNFHRLSRSLSQPSFDTKTFSFQGSILKCYLPCKTHLKYNHLLKTSTIPPKDMNIDLLTARKDQLCVLSYPSKTFHCSSNKVQILWIILQSCSLYYSLILHLSGLKISL